MIDFRYHVVSIIAVFLALSVGLVLGASFLKEAAVSGLDTQVQDLARNNEGLRRELDRANAGQKYLNGVINTVSPALVDRRLAGHKAVVVALPGADTKLTDSMVKLLDSADATVTGQVTIKGAWTDPKRDAELVTALGPTGAAGTSGSATDRAARVLAGAITEKTPPPGTPGTPGTGTSGTPGTPATQPPASGAPATGTSGASTPSTPQNGGGSSTPPGGQTPGGQNTTGTNTSSTHNTQAAAEALTRLKEAGFIDVKDNPATGADLVLIVAPSGAPSGDDPGRINNIHLSLVRALDSGGDGTVMVGTASAAQENGVIWALRRNDQTAKSVSTVDTADSPTGTVAIVWALVIEDRQGSSGQYGLTGSTSGPLPEEPPLKETP
ncbi:copper transporter [Embleya sp. NBC_00896]|uniref:copper transporter n=1 Tax=Embleya sp. NBC_00896 TaxID=2975961 RepID=UPI00386F7F2D|nr:copper transporter [Embleya sp. NBC_00896]